jgi:hypothetical protein
MSKKEKTFPKNILIGVFCEGKTEKAYIDKIRTTLFSQSNYKLIPIDCNSRNKIETEIEKSRKAKYDKKIAIFDREDINKPTDKKIFDGLIEFCNQRKITYLYSIPSFEVWLLLHKQEKIDLTKITNGSKAKEQVKEKFKISNNSLAEYEKVFSQIQQDRETAIKNSKENKILAHLKEKVSDHEKVIFITNFHVIFGENFFSTLP